MEDKKSSFPFEEWFEIAENDLNSATFLTGMKPAPLEIICYHCQQVAEKYLKDFLIQKQSKIILTHDLTLLYKKCLSINLSFAEIEEECIRLTDYAVTTRYPYPLEITETDMKLAITDAKKIRDFVLTMAK